MFKSIAKRLEELGFKKIEEDNLGASYSRVVPINDDIYVHRLDIVHKASGRHLIQSYEEDVNKDGFNNVVGLNYETTRLAMKKYRQLKRKYKW